MTYEEALAMALVVPWKVYSCGAEGCWCGLIGPQVPLVDDDDNEVWVVTAGSMRKEYAEHIVKLHNESLCTKD